MTPSPSAQTTTAKPSGPNALDLLRNDHRQILDLFSAYDKGRETMEVSKKTALAQRISKALAVHTAIEEEIFNPAIRETVESVIYLLDIAEVENSTIKRLANEVSSSTPSIDPRFDAKIAVLDKYFREHVRLKEDQLFPKIRKTALELSALGEQLALRRREALAAIGNTEMQS
jgi:hemerythrin superfamily protein